MFNPPNTSKSLLKNLRVQLSISTQYIYTSIKNILKMLKDVGMAVPKTTETRCRDGSVQARHVIQRLCK